MKPTADQIKAGCESAKSQIPFMYRHMVSDAEIESFVTKILTAALAAPTAGSTGSGNH
jgi:hypothetical protein